jgi:hypothetical protein
MSKKEKQKEIKKGVYNEHIVGMRHFYDPTHNPKMSLEIETVETVETENETVVCPQCSREMKDCSTITRPNLYIHARPNKKCRVQAVQLNVFYWDKLECEE